MMRNRNAEKSPKCPTLRDLSSRQNTRWLGLCASLTRSLNKHREWTIVFISIWWLINHSTIIISIFHYVGVCGSLGKALALQLSGFLKDLKIPNIPHIHKKWQLSHKWAEGGKWWKAWKHSLAFIRSESIPISLPLMNYLPLWTMESLRKFRRYCILKLFANQNFSPLSLYSRLKWKLLKGTIKSTFLVIFII